MIPQKKSFEEAYGLFLSINWEKFVRKPCRGVTLRDLRPPFRWFLECPLSLILSITDTHLVLCCVHASNPLNCVINQLGCNAAFQIVVHYQLLSLVFDWKVNSHFCCGGVTGVRYLKPPNPSICTEAWEDVLGCLITSPHTLPIPWYQSPDNSQLPGFTDAWSSTLANTFVWYISNDIACFYKLCGIFNTDTVSGSSNCPNPSKIWNVTFRFIKKNSRVM